MQTFAIEVQMWHDRIDAYTDVVLARIASDEVRESRAAEIERKKEQFFTDNRSRLSTLVWERVWMENWLRTLSPGRRSRILADKPELYVPLPLVALSFPVLPPPFFVCVCTSLCIHIARVWARVGCLVCRSRAGRGPDSPWRRCLPRTRDGNNTKRRCRCKFKLRVAPWT